MSSPFFYKVPVSIIQYSSEMCGLNVIFMWPHKHMMPIFLLKDN